MDVILVMCLGIIAGRFLIPKKAKKINEIVSASATCLLIFSMGVMLGKKENFIAELSSLGLSSLVLFIFPTLFSIIIVYILTKIFLEKRKKKEDNDSL